MLLYSVFDYQKLLIVSSTIQYLVKAMLKQTGIIENPNLKPEDESRANDLHYYEGVAFLVRKPVFGEIGVFRRSIALCVFG